MAISPGEAAIGVPQSQLSMAGAMDGRAVAGAGLNGGALPALGPRTMLAAMQDVFVQPAVRRAFPAIMVLMALMVIGGIYLWMQDTPYRPIMQGVTEADQHSAFESLKAANFNPRVDPATGSLMVPTARFHEARMLLASQGLPKEQNRGVLETLKDQTALTTSQFMEQARYSAAIEQELAKSIEQISTIQSARVHLAQPKQSAFLRDRMPAKASVVVTPYSGRMVSSGQVQAIIHLMASSVPFLATEDVSVVDNLGNLLTKSPADTALGLTATQLQIKEQAEDGYRNRVVRLLEPIVGEGNVRAQVDLTMNFTQVETTSEDFDTNRQGPKTRSEQLAEERTNKVDASGVPGALSNTPPPQPENKQDTAPTDEKNGVSTPVTSSRSTRNYEIDKVIRHVKSSLGGIERLTVAVVIRERQSAGGAKEKEKEKGQEAQQNAGYSPEEIERLNALVKGAVGFKEDRGDIVNILPARFEMSPGKPPAAWYESEMAANILKGGLATIVLLTVLLGVVRPVVKSYLPPPPPSVAPAPATALPAQSGAPANPDEPAAESAAADNTTSPEAAAEQTAAAGDAGNDAAEPMVMAEGESIEQFRERLRKSAAPKKSTISADMLDTANTYDDKVALLRLLVSEDSGRVANVLKTMIRLEGEA